MKPILWRLPWLDWPIFGYGFMLMLGFLAGTLLAIKHARREKVDEDRLMDLILFCVFGGGLIGARLFFFGEYWYDTHIRTPEHSALFGWGNIFEFWKGGLTFYGGFIIATLSSLAYLKWKKMSIAKVADILGVSAALGLVFGRIGCFLNGCCFGKVTDVSWGICYPRIVETVDPEKIQLSYVSMHQDKIGLDAPQYFSHPVHPTQIYSSFYNLLIFLFLLWFFSKKKYHGQVALAFAVIYSIARFTVEFFRADNELYFNAYTISQLVSLIVFPTALGLLIYHWKKGTALPDTVASGSNRSAGEKTSDNKKQSK